ncbi:NAD(P)H-binding protein [Nocardioides cynanchi]|uniref:NAD(P)H-binding protein n=1 Tax=Nocardioides cynanchi TaxID=2558918 RepID=UPI00307D5504
MTGATGAVGGLVARLLADRGIEQRLLVRDPARAPALDGAVTAVCEYADPDAARAALEGVTTLLMVSASESADRLDQHRAFVDAAAAAGVAHVVYTSFAGAAADCTFTLGRDHYATEQHLRASGMRHTFLRDNFYLDFLPLMVGEDGVIRGPAGRGRVAAVARADVARVAAAVLTDPGSHRDTTYTLTGPEALTLADAARTIHEVTGRDVTFHDETVEEAYASRRRWDAPPWQYDAWVSTYTAIRAGEVEDVFDDVQAVTGRRPVSLRELLVSGDPV